MCIKHNIKSSPCYLCELEAAIELEIERKEVNKIDWG